MLKKQDIGINLNAANNGYRDQSLTGIGGPRVYVKPSHTIPNVEFKWNMCNKPINRSLYMVYDVALVVVLVVDPHIMQVKSRFFLKI